MTGSQYRERLTVPLRWWVQAVMFLATLWLAFVVATPLWLATLVAGLMLAVTAGMFAWIGSALVEVTDTDLRAGRAQIPRRFLAEPEELDRDRTRAVLGPEAKATAFLLTRPYLHRAVRVPVTDPDDPTPYWLITTRHPERLAAALRR